MVKELSVRLQGLQVGILRLVKGKMEFTYDSATQTPISLSLPLQKESFKEKACRAFFGGLLPENPNIRELLAKKYNINVNDDFKLLEQIGRDCAGALSFHKIEEPQKLQQLIKIEGKVLSDQELKKYIEELPYRPYMGKRLSLAGAQEKTAVCVIDGEIALPNDNVPTTHIIKTALPKYRQSIENEYICMKAAKKIGLDVAKVEIRKVDNLEFLLVERFDRFLDEYCDGSQSFNNCEACNECTNHQKKYCLRMERVLQEDFAQSLGVQARDKYKVTFKDCLKILNQTSTPANAKLKFVKQVIFNYLIGNTDAHAKNFSIYLDVNNFISLTPAYDLLCSSVYDCDQRIAMKIGKAKFYTDVTEKDWEIFAQDLDISSKLVKSELERQKQQLPKIIEQLATNTNSEIGYEILDYIRTSQFCI